MIAIGNTESKVHGLFVGDTKIVSAYLGDQKVFPDNAQPFEIEPDWTNEDPDEEISYNIDEPTFTEQIEWVSENIQRPSTIPEETPTLSESQWQTLNQLVSEFVAEDPSIEGSSQELDENVSNLDEINQGLLQSLE